MLILKDNFDTLKFLYVLKCACHSGKTKHCPPSSIVVKVKLPGVKTYLSVDNLNCIVRRIGKAKL